MPIQLPHESASFDHSLRQPQSARVAFLVSHSAAGGAQEIWANLAEGFRARGCDVLLMALYPHSATLRQTSGMQWDYIVQKRPTTPWGMVAMLVALVRRLRSEKLAVVFTAMPAANVLAPLAARLGGGGTRVVISHHSPAETHNRMLNRLDSLVGLLASTKSVISVSNAVSASLDDKPAVYRAKRVTIHNALPPQIEAHIDSLSAKHRANHICQRTVVATGRLAAQKNYPTLIRAAQHLPDVDFIIVGNGPDEAMLKALAKDLGVEQRITFKGHRPREEALAILAEGDVFAQISLFEGHSLALIEAAKLGLPLVVSNVPVQIEGITAKNGERCGIAVEPSDDRALAREIKRLLEEPDHYALWAKQSRRLGQETTYDAMMDAYVELVD